MWVLLVAGQLQAKVQHVLCEKYAQKISHTSVQQNAMPLKQQRCYL